MLVVKPAYLRIYKPLASGADYNELNSGDATMVARRVPSGYCEALNYKDDRLYVGKTLFRAMEFMSSNEYAILLGGQ
eukprot:186588-Pyramimonas_sp.AAC.1